MPCNHHACIFALRNCLRFAALVLILALVPVAGQAQSQGTQQNPDRDAAAVNVMRQAIEAMGGQSVSSAALSGTMTLGTEGQTTKSIVIKIAGREMRVEVKSSGDQWVYVTGMGNPGRVSNGIAEQVPPRQARALAPFYVPGAVLASQLSSPQFALTFIGAETRDGRSVVHVLTVDMSDDVGQEVSPQDWYFDPTTYLPVAAEYRFPHPYQTGKFGSAAIEFDQYQQVQGVMQPFKMTLRGAGPPRAIVLSAVSLNAGTSAADFAPVTGGGQ